MNLLQMRQILEQVLGYADFTRSGNEWIKETREDAPGWYYQEEDVKICPAFYVVGKHRVPSNWQPRGLETILEGTPRMDEFQRLGGMERWSWWTVWIQQFDKDKTIFEHESMILRHFGSEAQSTRWRKDDNDLNDRRMLTIKTVDFDLSYYPTTANKKKVPSPVENTSLTTYYDQD